MQGEPYQAELRAIRLDGSNIILGIDWLRLYGKVTFDYNDHSVSFSKEGRQMTLKGITEVGMLKSISAEQWYKASLQGNCCAIARFASQEGGEEKEIPREIARVLK